MHKLAKGYSDVLNKNHLSNNTLPTLRRENEEAQRKLWQVKYKCDNLYQQDINYEYILSVKFLKF